MRKETKKEESSLNCGFDCATIDLFSLDRYEYEDSEQNFRASIRNFFKSLKVLGKCAVKFSRVLRRVKENRLFASNDGYERFQFR